MCPNEVEDAFFGICLGVQIASPINSAFKTGRFRACPRTGQGPRRSRSSGTFFITTAPSRPATPTDGRPTDDVFSFRFAFMTNGQIKPQSVKPHEDLLSEFPFMGFRIPAKVAASF